MSTPLIALRLSYAHATLCTWTCWSPQFALLKDRLISTPLIALRLYTVLATYRTWTCWSPQFALLKDRLMLRQCVKFPKVEDQIRIMEAGRRGRERGWGGRGGKRGKGGIRGGNWGGRGLWGVIERSSSRRIWEPGFTEKVSKTRLRPDGELVRMVEMTVVVWWWGWWRWL